MVWPKRRCLANSTENWAATKVSEPENVSSRTPSKHWRVFRRLRTQPVTIDWGRTPKENTGDPLFKVAGHGGGLLLVSLHRPMMRRWLVAQKVSWPAASRPAADIADWDTCRRKETRGAHGYHANFALNYGQRLFEPEWLFEAHARSTITFSLGLHRCRHTIRYLRSPRQSRLRRG